MKKGITLLMTAALVLGVTLCAAAATGEVEKKLNYADIKITLNGRTLTPTDAAGNAAEPFMVDDTVYLPVRAVAGALGLDVEWDSSTNTVKLSEPKPTPPPEPVVYPQGSIGSSYVLVKKAALALDSNGVPAVVITYLWQNNGDAATTAGMSFVESVTQNGRPLQYCDSMTGKVVYNAESKAAVVYPGSTGEVNLVYTLSNTTGPVEISISNPTNWGPDRDTLFCTFNPLRPYASLGDIQLTPATGGGAVYAGEKADSGDDVWIPG